MKLKFLMPLIVLLAMVSAIYAKANFFKRKAGEQTSGKIYISMAFPNYLDEVKAYDAVTGTTIFGKLNSDNIWELSLDPSHHYQLEVLYNSTQGSFNSLSFAGITQKIKSVKGSNWYRVTNRPSLFMNGSSYVLYSCQGTNCFD